MNESGPLDSDTWQVSVTTTLGFGANASGIPYALCIANQRVAEHLLGISYG